MDTDENMKEIHRMIQQNIFKMIPERFKKICLYASIIEGHKQTNGEMFFYYFPSGLLKKNPINVYEIPEIFSIDEEQYAKLEQRLYESIKRLQDYYRLNNKIRWSNLTIVITGTKYVVEFNYDNLINTQFSSRDRHIIWRYKYLELPIESFNKEERAIIDDYFNSLEYQNARYVNYEENVYEKQRVSIMDYNSYNTLNEKTKKQDDVDSLKEPKDKEKESDEKPVKNQLLNF